MGPLYLCNTGNLLIFSNIPLISLVNSIITRLGIPGPIGVDIIYKRGMHALIHTDTQTCLSVYIDT